MRDTGDRLTDVGGVDAEQGRALRQAGYRTVDDLRAASEDDIAAVEGISAPLAAHIKADIASNPEEDTASDASDPEASGDDGRGDSLDPGWRASERLAEDSEWHTVDSQPARVPSTAPYFEETITPRVPGGVFGFVFGVALLFGGSFLGLILLVAPLNAVVWRAVVIAVLGWTAFGAAFGAGIYSRMRVFVKVTDTGVEVVRNWNSRRGAERATIPFESISRVQTTDAIRPHRPEIERQYTDAPLQAYMITTGWLPVIDLSYRTGVRIERTDGPPVYVGTARPGELAAVLTAKTPSADRESQENTTDRMPATSGSPSLETGKKGMSGAPSDQAQEADKSGEFEGTVPGMSKKREKRGVVAVILFGVGMIVAIKGFGVLGVFAFLGVLGVLFVYGGTKAWLSQRRQLATFEPTTGVVVATKLVDLPRSRRRPLIKYEYTVDGETYENDKIWPGGPGAKQMGPRASHDFLSEYPEGEQTTVYYDPENPSDAYIRRSSNTRWFALVLLVGLGLVGYLVLLLLGVAPPPDI